jgi:prevent-host-death family protein
MKERQVGLRELKTQLSAVMRRVKAGESILVTEHGRVIGQILPVQPTAAERLQAMADTGQIAWNGQGLRSHQPRVVNRGDRLLSDLIVEDRE